MNEKDFAKTYDKTIYYTIQRYVLFIKHYFKQNYQISFELFLKDYSSNLLSLAFCWWKCKKLGDSDTQYGGKLLGTAKSRRPGIARPGRDPSFAFNTIRGCAKYFLSFFFFIFTFYILVESHLRHNFHHFITKYQRAPTT